MKNGKILIVAGLWVGLGCSGKESAGSLADDSTAAQSRVAVTPATPPIDPTLWLTSAPGHAADFDSTRRLEIIWTDPKTRTRPESVRLRGESGRWAVDPGVRLGMRLTDLERINGGPFTLAGFGWDYGGTITNWRGGKLTHLGSKLPRLFIRLSPADTVRVAARDSVEGDREFISHDQRMQQLNPHVQVISVVYRMPRN